MINPFTMKTTILALLLALSLTCIAAQTDSSTASMFNSSSSSSGSQLNNQSSSSSSQWMNDSSSSTGVVDPASSLSSAAQAGLVVWGIICFSGVIIFTSFLLNHYARPGTPVFALFLVWLAWIVTFSVCFLVPIDLLPDVSEFLNGVWNALYWTSFLLMWLVIPFASGFYDNGGFTVKQRMLASLKFNAILIGSCLIVGLIGFIYLVLQAGWSAGDVGSMLVCASTVWGLIMLVVSAGWGLVEIPRTLYFHTQTERRRNFIHFNAGSIHHESQEARDVLVATMYLLRQLDGPMTSKVNLDSDMDRSIDRSDDRLDVDDQDDHDETDRIELRGSHSQKQAIHQLHLHYFRTIQSVVRPHESDLNHLLPRGGGAPVETLPFAQELMASARTPDGLSLKQLLALHHHTRNASKRLMLVETQWRDTVDQALSLNADLAGESQWRHFKWFVGHTKQKIIQICFICSVVLSVLILFCEITVPTSDSVSPLGLLVEVTRSFFVAEQIFTAVPLTYLAICAYYPLFQLRLSSMYYMGRHRTDETTLLFNATLLLRISVPLAFNFILLLHVNAGSLTSFIGKVNVIPFFGSDFTRYFPVIMAVIAVLVFSRVIHYMARCIGVDSVRFHLARNVDDDPDVKFLIDEGRTLIESELKRRSKMSSTAVNKSNERTLVDGLAARVKAKLNTPRTADDEARERMVELGSSNERARRSNELAGAIGDRSINQSISISDDYDPHASIDFDGQDYYNDNAAAMIGDDLDDQQLVYDAEGFDQNGFDVNGYDRYGGYVDENGDYVDPNDVQFDEHDDDHVPNY